MPKKTKCQTKNICKMGKFSKKITHCQKAKKFRLDKEKTFFISLCLPCKQKNRARVRTHIVLLPSFPCTDNSRTIGKHFQKFSSSRHKFLERGFKIQYCSDVPKRSQIYYHKRRCGTALFLIYSRVDPLTSILTVLARSCQILTTSWQPWIPWQDSY